MQFSNSYINLVQCEARRVKAITAAKTNLLLIPFEEQVSFGLVVSFIISDMLKNICKKEIQFFRKPEMDLQWCLFYSVLL